MIKSLRQLGVVLAASLCLMMPSVALSAADSAPEAKSQTKTQAKKKHAKKKPAHLNKTGKARVNSRAAKRLQRERERELSEYREINGLPVLRSAYALVLDQKSGEPIFSKNPDHATPIASITKLMTAMVVLDASLPMEEIITVSDADVDHMKHTRSRLPVGTAVARSDLMHMALIASENRAAAALSRAYPGGRQAFVSAMNAKATKLGMKDANFVDGTGLSSANRASAQDLARMVTAAYSYAVIREISTMGSYDILVPGRRALRTLAYNNTNALTRNKNWEIGVSKTGFINEAGHCLVMQAKISDKPMIIVLLDAQGKNSRIGDANRLRRWLESDAMARVAARKDKPRRPA